MKAYSIPPDPPGIGTNVLIMKTWIIIIIKSKKFIPIGIFKAIKLVMPYCLIISITWLLLLLGWYIIGLPIGPNVYPTV